jgi:hypothetical protein
VCNLITTIQVAIIALFRVTNRYLGNLPPMPGMFPTLRGRAIHEIRYFRVRSRIRILGECWICRFHHGQKY